MMSSRVCEGAGYSDRAGNRQSPRVNAPSEGFKFVERVAVIGNSGGGKSVLARQIAARFDLPYIEIDGILWRNGWRLAPEAEYRSQHDRIIAQDRWVIDGLGRRDSAPARLARATDIVLIDLPLWVHFWLAAERQIKWASGSLNDPPAGIDEMPTTRGLFQNIWEVDRSWMPELRQLAATEAARGKTVIRLTSLEELDGFSASL
jgi:hypothetical protein